MAIRDTDITDWSTTAASNPPTDGTYIGGDLAGQFRNIKSVWRAESLAKEWEKTGYVTAGATAGTPSLISFSAADGDLTATFVAKRKVRLRLSNGSTDYVYCGVLSSSFSTVTSVILVDLFGSVTTSEEYFVDVGVEFPAACPIPLFTQSGTVSFSDTTTIANATFSHAEADLDYFPKLTVTATNSAVAGSSVISDVSKDTDQLQLTLNAAPGAGKTVTFAWTIMREF